MTITVHKDQQLERILDFVAMVCPPRNKKNNAKSTKHLLDTNSEDDDFLLRSLTRKFSSSYDYSKKIDTLSPSSSQSTFNTNDSSDINKITLSPSFHKNYSTDFTDPNTISKSVSPSPYQHIIRNNSKSFHNFKEKNNHNESQQKTKHKDDIATATPIRMCDLSGKQYQENCTVAVDIFYSVKRETMDLDIIESIDIALMKLIADNFLQCSDGLLNVEESSINAFAVSISDPSKVIFLGKVKFNK